MGFQFDVFVALSWILFIALFPMCYIWLRRAYKIFIKKDYSEVALKNGKPPKNPEDWAIFTGLVNLGAGLAILYAIIGVVFFAFPYGRWTAIAGITIWFKILGDFTIRVQAHPPFKKDTN